uniref:Uncharacterized protein n=1 Tax=Anguilla anguilla TaxID=7936 RepID=A0A0E9RCH7_ANGAN
MACFSKVQLFYVAKGTALPLADNLGGYPHGACKLIYFTVLSL